jgi:hypothetical protein
MLYKNINRFYVILVGLTVIITCSYIKVGASKKKEEFDNSADESACTYVSSRGIVKSCDVHNTVLNAEAKDIDFDLGTIQKGATVYVPNSAMRNFVKKLNKVPHPIILVSGDGDETVFKDVFGSHDDFIRFIEQDKVIHWFSQNCTVSHSKITQIPIGLDYHTMTQGDNKWGPRASPVEQEAVLWEIKARAAPFYKRKIQCYGNFHLNIQGTFAGERRAAKAEIPADAIVYQPGKLSRKETWAAQIEYAFVVSPPGNGLDCHRTWEALCLGCIPIVKTSELDPLFEDLPVLIVESWSEVSLENLNKVVEQFQYRTFNYEKLKLNYWMDKIHSFNDAL